MKKKRITQKEFKKLISDAEIMVKNIDEKYKIKRKFRSSFSYDFVFRDIRDESEITPTSPSTGTDPNINTF